MPQISEIEFVRLPLRAHQLLAGVPLHDVWAVDLPGPRTGITLEQFCALRTSNFSRPRRWFEDLWSYVSFSGASSGGTGHEPWCRARRRLPTDLLMQIGHDRLHQLAFAKGRMGYFALSINSRTKN